MQVRLQKIEKRLRKIVENGKITSMQALWDWWHESTEFSFQTKKS